MSDMEKINRIGIMGGTFDPPHLGHLILAQSAYEALQLDRVWFIPSGNPPHKRNRNDGEDDSHRVEMTRLAIESDSRFVLDLMEMDEEDYTYTYLTLEKLNALHPENDYYFIIGEDSLVDFSTWKCPERIVQLCHIVVGFRPGTTTDRIEDVIRYNKDLYGGDFIQINTPAIEISSSDIRKRIRNGCSFRYFVPEKVYDYIERNRLYVPEGESCCSTANG